MTPNSTHPPPTVIIGLGNPLRADDGVGHAVSRLVRQRLSGRTDVEVMESFTGGLRLMERLIDRQRAYIVDAARFGEQAGKWRWLDLRQLPTLHTSSTHDADLATALAVGRRAGAFLPDDDQIHVLAIQIADVDGFSEELTTSVRSAVPGAADALLERLNLDLGRGPTRPQGTS
ncbi:MAG: hydrogenase maturation protease [Anaerolineales bacterium]